VFSQLTYVFTVCSLHLYLSSLHHILLLVELFISSLHYVFPSFIARFLLVSLPVLFYLGFCISFFDFDPLFFSLSATFLFT
jgi:hypothetical protein